MPEPCTAGACRICPPRMARRSTTSPTRSALGENSSLYTKRRSLKVTLCDVGAARGARGSSPEKSCSSALRRAGHYPALSLAIVEGHSRAAASGVGQACTGHSVTLLQYRDNLGLDEYCASTRDQPSAACRDLTFLCPVKAGIGATM